MLAYGAVQLLSADDDDDEDDDDDDQGIVPRDKNLTRKTVRAIQQLYSEGRQVYHEIMRISFACRDVARLRRSGCEADAPPFRYDSTGSRLSRRGVC